jgi:protein-L-isoaspartate(D-aspartate) O-methyltransferase
MFEKQREEMVQKYVIGEGISDEKVIAALRKIPRHLFVEAPLRHQAYFGKSLPIGFGQTISHPTTVAMMSENLEIRGNERVLEIGTGSGYQAAVLAEIGAKVYTIERIPELARRAQKLFDELGYYSIGVWIGDGSVGWNAHAPYDRIIVTAASPGVPETLLNQLADKGRLIVPVGEKTHQKLIIITREGADYHILAEHSRSFVPLIGKKGWTL